MIIQENHVVSRICYYYTIFYVMFYYIRMFILLSADDKIEKVNNAVHAANHNIRKDFAKQ